MIAADPPEVGMAHDILLALNTAVRKRLPYRSKASQQLRYTIRSSDPALVTVQTPELVIPGSDVRYIELVFHAFPANLSYNAEVYLFIASEDKAIQETRMLQLTYT
eukprot:gnl/TRDRNA2_/TRDRNA2_165016_c1_seq1.p1 gnl/TRDRNA2_/TRDRNA2_165016_c1~~gnl/TRDRNA2_/TRDRNA2_165016_c1_seq1.p1  ORF type:complete len:120 (-),score=8.69 gnl/TRDRNA2_/TRDRNA2_165016_c1_seq1:52-369(-)